MNDIINAKPKRKRGRPRKPRDNRELLASVSGKAIKMLIDAMDNTELTANARLDAAKEIINRVYGKNPTPIDDDSGTIVLVMEDEVRELTE